jgi:hypothetical protein
MECFDAWRNKTVMRPVGKMVYLYGVRLNWPDGFDGSLRRCVSSLYLRLHERHSIGCNFVIIRIEPNLCPIQVVALN